MVFVFVPRARADCLLQHGGRHGRDAIRFHAEREEELRRRDFVQDDGGPRGREEHRFQGSGRFHRRRRPRRRFFRHHHLRRRDPRPAGAVLDRSLSLSLRWDGMGSSAKVSVGHRASFVHALVALFFIRYLSLAARFFSLPVPRQPLVRTLNRDRRPRLGFTQPITLTRVIESVRSRHFTSFAPSVNTRTLRDGSLNSVGQSEVLIHHIEISDLHVEVHD